MSDVTREVVDAFAPFMGASLDAQARTTKLTIAGKIAAVILGARARAGSPLGEVDAREAAGLGFAAASEILRLAREGS